MAQKSDARQPAPWGSSGPIPIHFSATFAVRWVSVPADSHLPRIRLFRQGLHKSGQANQNQGARRPRIPRGHCSSGGTSPVSYVTVLDPVISQRGGGTADAGEAAIGPPTNLNSEIMPHQQLNEHIAIIANALSCV